MSSLLSLDTKLVREKKILIFTLRKYLKVRDVFLWYSGVSLTVVSEDGIERIPEY